jgi:hypothetical protein
MKVAVFGNCQRSGITRALQLMNRGVLADEFDDAAGFDPKSKLADTDIVCAQLNISDSIREYVTKFDKKLIFYPRVNFAGFHPDMTYVNKVGAGAIKTPFGSYNSILTFFGWQNGLSVAQTTELFTHEIYDLIGYYNDFAPSHQALMREGVEAGMPLEAAFRKWSKRGCFMHTFNHPKIFSIIDLARAILAKIDIAVDEEDPERFMFDHLINSTIWPIYPEIAARLGFKGEYLFKTPIGRQSSKIFELLPLGEMVERSFAAYAPFRPDELWCPRVRTASFNQLKGLLTRQELGAARLPRQVSSNDASEETRRSTRNPYAKLPSYQFWRKAIETVAIPEVDPVVRSAFRIDRTQKVATAGSCFAQHISRTLEQSGFTYYVAENAGTTVAETEAVRRNYRVFSARFGNVYTVRQLVQLFDRAYGSFVPDDVAWERADGRYVDPFRPQIEPDGFATIQQLVESRAVHLGSVREMFEGLDILVFTLGLTEAWQSKRDGAVFPLAPGVSGGQMDFDRYGFVNFRAAEISADLDRFIGKLSRVNPRAKVILTVSPVPLIATYEDRHVLVSNTYSKSALRVAADDAARAHQHVAYFPSYEVIVGNYNKSTYYETDLRSVKPQGVAHVMRLFLNYYSTDGQEPEPEQDQPVELDERALEFMKSREIVCDEEEIVRWNQV